MLFRSRRKGAGAPKDTGALDVLGGYPLTSLLPAWLSLSAGTCSSASR